LRDDFGCDVWLVTGVRCDGDRVRFNIVSTNLSSYLVAKNSFNCVVFGDRISGGGGGTAGLDEGAAAEFVRGSGGHLMVWIGGAGAAGGTRVARVVTETVSPAVVRGCFGVIGRRTSVVVLFLGRGEFRWR
jgi:hypothetical protein